MIVIIDYGAGNLGSIHNMLKKIGADAVLSSNADHVARANKLILPGVGAFEEGMKNLRLLGLDSALSRKVQENKTPFLGICLGMQLMTKWSEEGNVEGLGWIDARTVRFAGTEGNLLKVPHMGWNTAKATNCCPLVQGMPEEPRFYFAHSYHVIC